MNPSRTKSTSALQQLQNCDTNTFFDLILYIHTEKTITHLLNSYKKNILFINLKFATLTNYRILPCKYDYRENLIFKIRLLILIVHKKFLQNI